MTIILAAGVGSRLHKPWPKPLTPVQGDETILGRQVRLLRPRVDPEAIHIVVGHKMSAIMEAQPDLCFLYNELYDQTNTSKSLLRGLRKARRQPVLWLNGDVVLEAGVVERVLAAHEASTDEDPTAWVAVHYGPVGDEEVTFLGTGGGGDITAIAKGLPGGLGEAVGVNLANAAGATLLRDALERCADEDYFERGLEIAREAGLRLVPVDVTDLLCIEVDFQEDLDAARGALEGRAPNE